VDYNLPERFDLEYVAENNERRRPVMIHRAPFGSLERFIGILIEHFNGAFPAWLAPVQAVLIPVADRHVDYARQVAVQLRLRGLRVDVDDSEGRVGAKVREATLQKIPWMLVVGDRDIEQKAVSVRLRTGDDLGAMPLAGFIEYAGKIVETKSLALK
jgi:threonyl-tRNA synthetase